MYRARLGEEQSGEFEALKVHLAECYRPLLRPALDAAANVLGVAPERLRMRQTPLPNFLEPSRLAVDAEVFADGKNLIVVALNSETELRHGRRRPQAPSEEGSSKPQYRLDVVAFGPEAEPASLEYSVRSAQEILGVTLAPYTFPSEQFASLKAEARESPSEPTAAERAAAELLRDRTIRTIVIAIKSSGGLLVRDLPKQLGPDDRARVEELTAELRRHGIVDSEIVVVCSKSQAQVTRAPTRELLEELSSKGLKCACGRPLAEERIEEALAITDLGRSVLDKGRWLTLLLVEELHRLGIPYESILLEQTIGGDEIDCVANISGELALFELKDKEFNLGDAYSFGAKIGIIRPDHAVIVTTERVGNDAKEHFVRARLVGRHRERYRTFLQEFAGIPTEEEAVAGGITYIEGLDSLPEGVQGLVGSIYRRDAARLLDEVLPLAALRGLALIQALEDTQGTQVASQQQHATDGATRRG